MFHMSFMVIPKQSFGNALVALSDATPASHFLNKH